MLASLRRAAKQEEERDDGEKGEEHLGRRSELACEEVGQGEELHLIERPCEEDAIQHERQAEANRQTRAVPPVQHGGRSTRRACSQLGVSAGDPAGGVETRREIKC